MPFQTTAAFVAITASLACCQQDQNAPQRIPGLGVRCSEQPAVDAINGLAVDLFHELGRSQPDRNMFFSPYSIAAALAMAAEGARDETAREMAQVLHFPPEPGPGASGRPITAVHGGFAALSQRLGAGGGAASIEVRKRIEHLQSQLAAANRRAEELQGQSKWQEASAAEQDAARLATVLNALSKTVDRYDLSVANALWVERTFGLARDYAATIERYYGTGGATALDIAGNAEQARQRINGWVEEHTNHRIKDLIPQLAPDARLVITNAVWFRGEWATPFAASATREDDFTLAGGERIKRKMMRDMHRAEVPYAAFRGDGSFFATPTEVPADEAQRPPTYPDDSGFTLIELPYKGDELTMLVVAPRSPDGLARVETLLTTASLASWLQKLAARTVDTTMLRFELGAGYALPEALQSLGIKRAFANPLLPGGAQFPGMSASPDPERQLHIADVRHKAWIEVDEKGTEAAAATSIAMTVGAAIRPVETVPFTPVFRADRPFLFLIRDAKSGAILFLGRIVDPRP